MIGTVVAKEDVLAFRPNGRYTLRRPLAGEEHPENRKWVSPSNLLVLAKCYLGFIGGILPGEAHFPGEVLDVGPEVLIVATRLSPVEVGPVGWFVVATSNLFDWGIPQGGYQPCWWQQLTEKVSDPTWRWDFLVEHFPTDCSIPVG